MGATSEARQVGGGFLIFDSDPALVVTPEDFTEEQRMFAETTRAFLEGDVLPQDEHIERLDYELTVRLMRKAGELGLLAADVPEAYGGLGLDKVTVTSRNTRSSGFTAMRALIGFLKGRMRLTVCSFRARCSKKQ